MYSSQLHHGKDYYQDIFDYRSDIYAFVAFGICECVPRRRYDGYGDASIAGGHFLFRYDWDPSHLYIRTIAV